MNRSLKALPGSVLKGLIPVLETVQTRLVLKRPQRALNRRTLDQYHRALDSWSQRVLDQVSECSALFSDSEGPGLVSERPGSDPREPWTWSQKALDRRTQDRSHRVLDRVSECSRLLSNTGSWNDLRRICTGSHRVLNWSQNDLGWSLTGEGPVDQSQMYLQSTSRPKHYAIELHVKNV